MKKNYSSWRFATVIVCIGLVWSAALPVSAALTHRYSFTNDVSDSVGSANGTIINNVIISSGVATFPGTNVSGPNGDYIQLPAGLISNYTAVTFEFWISATGPANAGTWDNLYAFGNTNNGLGANLLTFTPHSGVPDFRMTYGQADPGFTDEHNLTGLGVLDDLGLVHVACVYDPSKNLMTLYTNGGVVDTLFPVTTGAKGFSLTNVFNVYSWLGRSLYNGDAGYAGDLDEFRIYDTAVGSLQIAVNAIAGPDDVVAPVTATSFVWNVNTNMALGERQGTSVSFTTASFGTLTLNSATDPVYASANTNVVVVTPAGRLLAVGTGTASVTATYAGTTTSQVITVGTPILAHRYSFTTDAHDSAGTADGTLQGTAAIVNKAVFLSGTNGTSGAPGDYVAFPPDMLTNITSTTFEIWATDLGSATWARIWDFGNSVGGNGGDNAWITPLSSAGTLRFAIALTGGEQQLNTSPVGVGQENHIVWVDDALHQTGYLYVNGALAAVNNSMTFVPADMGSTANDWLGRSQYSGDPLFNGTIDEFRIWRGVMSPFQVAINAASGPDTLGPADPGTVQSITLTIQTNVLVGARQNAAVHANFSIVTNVNVSTLGTTYSSANPAIATVDTNGLIAAVAPGSTTITATYNGKSDTKSISVSSKPSVLAHRWSFNESSGTVVHDSVGTANGNLSASGATLANGSVTLDGGSGFVDFPGHLIDGFDAVTFETWVTVSSSTVNNLSSRLFVFGSADAVNEVGFTARSGGQNTFLRYFGPTQVSVEEAGTYAIDAQIHLVGIFNAPSGSVDLYVNGLWLNSATSLGWSLSSITNTMSRLGATLATNLFTAADINEFRIYNGALDIYSIRTSYAAGPDNQVLDGGTPTSLALAVDPTMVLGSKQLPHVHCSFASVTNVDLTEAIQISYSSSDPSVVAVTTDGLLQGVTAGTATITASFRGKSDNKSVTVFPKQTMLVHRYSFTNDVSDSVGVQHGIPVGTAQISGGAAVLSGGAGLSTSYVDLPKHLVSTYDAVTLESWVTLPSPVQTWARIFDFGDQSAGAGGLSYIFLTPHSGGATTRSSLSSGGGGGGEANVDVTPVIDGFSGQVAVVYDTTVNQEAIYTNGVLAGSGTLAGKLLSNVNDLHCWLGKSLYPDPGLSGSIDEFRIYAGALTPSQIQADFVAGPDRVVLPPPVSSGPKVSISHSGNNVVLSWPDPGNSFTIQSRSAFGAGSSWAPLSVQINRANGTATATIPITGQISFYRLSNP